MKIIQVKNLVKTFKKPIRGEGLKGMIKTLFSRKYEPIPAVKGVNFEIEQGEIVGYIGANGAGKSTLLRCINFLEKADEGKIFVEDKLIFDASDKEKKSAAAIRKSQLNFGMVFQSFNLFPQYNVLENVTLR